ncbi:MAG: hypothetical protein M1813_002146 [Trichoglossum hirsutum]|nr:MAG: hypothetical protein M1813_002146 [Trichoglossum hirsutum]
MSSMDMDMMALNMYTRPDCYAKDGYYMMSMAYCLSTRCPTKNLTSAQSKWFANDRVSDAKLTWFWENRITGDHNVIPKWTYSEALARVTEPPTRVVSGLDTLNYTGLANDTVWIVQAGTLWSVYREGAVETKYGLAILITGFALPIVLTLFTYLPFATSLIERLKPYLVYPSIIGSYHVRPLPYLLGNSPTAGQGIYIAIMIIISTVLTGVGYGLVIPHAWYGPSLYLEGLAYVMWRTGTLGFAILPLVFLFSSRNNILLWFTNWSHSTFLLLHRWVARIFGVYVIVHSILALILYVKENMFASNEKMAWWIWGVVATLTTSLMLVLSTLYFRRKSYELFLITHILLAIFTLVGCWYHVFIRFGLIFEYQQWLYISFAIWAFDRTIRVLRILKTGVRRSKITDLGDGYVRVDVQGVRWDATPGKHAYAYFPTLNPLRPWENHPFSMLPTSLLQSYRHSLNASNSDGESSNRIDIEKNGLSGTAKRPEIVGGDSTAGVTFLIRKSTGMTKFLAEHDNVLTFLDGPYPNNPTDSVLRCDRLVIISGGIGISGIPPWLNAHPNAKLYWSVKKSAECLVEAVEHVLNSVVEKDVRVGQRLDIRGLIDQEIECGWKKIGVVACGPDGLCDNVRTAVVEAGRKGQLIELEVDAYSW